MYATVSFSVQHHNNSRWTRSEYGCHSQGLSTGSGWEGMKELTGCETPLLSEQESALCIR